MNVFSTSKASQVEGQFGEKALSLPLSSPRAKHGSSYVHGDNDCLR